MKPTKLQSDIIYGAGGHFLVRACPGSGKTFTIASRILHDLKTWPFQKRGIAALSFTNAAKDELESQLLALDNVKPVRYPHLISTIDSFINTHIFLPFAKLVLEFEGDAEMIGEPFGEFLPPNYYQRISVFVRYSIDTGPTIDHYRGLRANLRPNVLKAKADLIAKGLFTQADANYYALEILKKYPKIARSIAYRFPTMLVDEAQDSTDIQWEILKLIAGQPHIVNFGIIGDPDQAIYEWNGAKPEIFTAHEEELKKVPTQVYYLTESRRSSDIVCTFYKPLSTLQDAPVSINPDLKDHTDMPEIWSYDETDIGSLIDQVNRFRGQDLIDDVSFVLCRERSLIQKMSIVNGDLAYDLYPWGESSHKASYALLKARYLYDKHYYRDAHKEAEVALHMLYGTRLRDQVFADRNEWKEWHSQVNELIRVLPSTEGLTLGDWSALANQSMNELGLQAELKPRQKSSKADYPSLLVSVFFPDSEAETLGVQTVHAVKGQTADRVMLILPSAKAKKLVKYYNGEKALDEEARIQYVAITRARRKVVISVPHDTYDSVTEALLIPPGA